MGRRRRARGARRGRRARGAARRRAAAHERLGRVAIARTGERSSARWLGPGDPPPFGRYATFLARRGGAGRRLPLRLEGPDAARDALAERLAGDLERLALAWRTARTLASGTGVEPRVNAEVVLVSEDGLAPIAPDAEGRYPVQPGRGFALRVRNTWTLGAHVNLVAVLPGAQVLHRWRTLPGEPLRPDKERVTEADVFEPPPAPRRSRHRPR